MNDEQLEEERRLFYVCVTRAKEQLYVIYPVNIYDRRSRVMCQPSRFVEDLDPKLYEQWDLLEDDDFDTEPDGDFNIDSDDDRIVH